MEGLGEDLASSPVDARDERAAHSRIERTAGEHLERGDTDQGTTEGLGESDRRGDTDAQPREESRAAVNDHSVDVARAQLDLFEQGLHRAGQGLGVAAPVVHDARHFKSRRRADPERTRGRGRFNREDVHDAHPSNWAARATASSPSTLSIRPLSSSTWKSIVITSRPKTDAASSPHSTSATALSSINSPNARSRTSSRDATR